MMGMGVGEVNYDSKKKDVEYLTTRTTRIPAK